MPITNKELWNLWVKKNKEPYGKACVDVARRVMEILDETDHFDPWDIINQADKEIKAGGITGFMAGAVAAMVSSCHSRGPEFREVWNKAIQVKDEGDKATEKGTTLNPAILTIET